MSLTIAAATGLVACGGGGGGGGTGDGPGVTGVTPSVQSAIAGRWTGGAGARRVMQTHTFPDGSVWAIYSEDASQLHGGFIHVNGSVAGNTVSGSGRNFNRTNI